ncbi:MAG: hypothetical protein M1829_004934 [Trizodia sp. TS-e1964]|nr:MAG: hypothetical protein M1829_004934 [Trizodia sp. TS-e1964]
MYLHKLLLVGAIISFGAALVPRYAKERLPFELKNGVYVGTQDIEKQLPPMPCGKPKPKSPYGRGIVGFFRWGIAKVTQIKEDAVNFLTESYESLQRKLGWNLGYCKPKSLVHCVVGNIKHKSLLGYESVHFLDDPAKCSDKCEKMNKRKFPLGSVSMEEYTYVPDCALQCRVSCGCSWVFGGLKPKKKPASPAPTEKLRSQKPPL